MRKKYSYIIGVMSGTSLDGLDLVYVRFGKDDFSDFEILDAITYSYSEDWKNKLKEAINFTADELQQLDIEYGTFLGMQIKKFIDKYKIKKIDFIASHGHTVLHQPDEGITLQVGSGQEIANATEQQVICDFRTQDVKLGGQGAPLVPIGDELLFGTYEYCLNLGGFANISFKEDGKRIAFDICPVNIVLNKYAQKLGFEYDDKGKIASAGMYIEELDQELRSLDFYQKKAPKSLGLEWVQQEISPRLELSGKKTEDILRTFTEHAAYEIANALPKDAKVLVTGGGVFNDYLIARVNFNKKINFIIPNKKLIEFKEALIFAFLGLLRFDNQVNCLSSVTGAIKDHSSGAIFYPE